MTDKVSLAAYHKAGITGLMQSLVEIAYKQGLVDGAANTPKKAFSVENSRSSPGNMRKLIQTAVEKNKEEYYNKIALLVKDGCSIVTDLTTTGHHFIGYVLTYVSNNFEMEKVQLRLDRFPGSATAVALKAHIETELHKVKKSISDVTVVADGASTNSSAFKDGDLITCAVHLINTVGKKALKPYTTTPMTPEITSSMATIKEAVTNAKSVTAFVRNRAELLNSLKHRLVSPIDVRFMSTYDCLNRFVKLSAEERKSIRAHMTKSPAVAKQFKQVEKHFPLLTAFLHLLEPFLIALRDLESDTTITIHKVAPYYRELEGHLTFHASSGPVEIQSVSTVLLFSLQRNEGHYLSYIHFLGAALDPFLDKHKLKNLFLEKYEEYKKRLLSETAGFAPKVDGSFSPSLAEEFGGSSNRSQAEASEYFGTTFKKDAGMTIESWWRDNAETYPILAKMAKRTLCIPASSSACERLFSELKSMFGLHRHRLKPANVNNYVVLKEMYRLLEKVEF